MFRLVRITDVVRVPPHRLGEERVKRLEDEVNGKYANRVLDGQGMCIQIWDWIAIGEDRILDGDGATATQATFRMVVFCPYEGEVVLGRVRLVDATGLHLSVGFFDDIFVGTEDVQEPSTYDADESAWVWNYEGNELYIYEFDYVWFKVLHIQYTNAGDRDTSAGKKSPMRVKASISGEGLGSVPWWT